MKIPLHSFLLLELLTAHALGNTLDLYNARREINVPSDLDEWLAATKRVSSETLRPCPISCRQADSGNSSAGWYLFSDSSSLAQCNETMLVDMAVHTGTEDDPTTLPMAIRACTADYDSLSTPEFVPNQDKASLCTTANRILEDATVYIHHPEISNRSEFSADHLLSAGHQIVNHLAIQKPSCNDSAMEFAISQSSAIGLFSGTEVHQWGVASDILKRLLEYAQAQSVLKTTVIQLCGIQGRGADYSLGIVATNSNNFPFIQQSVKTWAHGGCVTEAKAGETWMNVTLRVPQLVSNSSSITKNMTSSWNHTTSGLLGVRSRLRPRDDCRTITVQDNDGCWSLANKCGISQDDLQRFNRDNICNTLVRNENVCCSSGTLPSTIPSGNSDGTCKTISVVFGDDCGSLASKCGLSGADFMKVNPKWNLCGSLAVNQPVCCTDGHMRDLKPKPDSNGNCATYTIQQNDDCSGIAAARDLNIYLLEWFNKDTWGWNGCNKPLYPNFQMCVSTGRPPMPASVSVS